MMRFAFTLMAGLCVTSAAIADEPAAKRTEDVVYGRKFGTALTMDVFTPAKPNGVGLIFVVSGGSAYFFFATGTDLPAAVTVKPGRSKSSSALPRLALTSAFRSAPP